MNKAQRLEFKFYKYVFEKVNSKNFSTKDLNDIYVKFKQLINDFKTDEISVLRKGEVFLGNYTKDIINFTDTEEVKNYIIKIMNAAADDLDITAGIAIIGAIVKLSLNKFDNVEEE